MTVQDAPGAEESLLSISWADLLQMHLFYGADRAITLGQLAEEMGARRRAIEQAVEQLRFAGVPVCSGRRGIYLSMDQSVIDECAERLRRRAVNQLLTARALKRTARRYGKQTQTEIWARPR